MAEAALPVGSSNSTLAAGGAKADSPGAGTSAVVPPKYVRSDGCSTGASEPAAVHPQRTVTCAAFAFHAAAHAPVASMLLKPISACGMATAGVGFAALLGGGVLPLPLAYHTTSA